MRITSLFSCLLLGSLVFSGSGPALADTSMDSMSMSMPMTKTMNPMVGGHAMYASHNIIQNALHSDDNTILVKAVKAAGLVATLEGPGPFTVFAPTDEAFKALPPDTLPTLLKPENKMTLKHILTYHVVAGLYDFEALSHKIKADGGSASLTTVAGEHLTAKFNGPHNIILIDSKGTVAHISTYDVYQSNGVINVIDHVVAP